MGTLKDHVRGTSTFLFYRRGELHYRTDTGLEFVVPIDDCGDATFLAQDKSLLLMRYIRKQLDLNAEGRAASDVPEQDIAPNLGGEGQMQDA